MTTTEYRNFDLLITRAGDNYKAIVVDAPAGEASVLFDLPSASAELAGLGGLVRGLRRNIGVAEAPESQPAPSLTGLGSRLFQAIFRDKVGALLAASQASVSQEGAGLRLRLRFEEDAAQLALLPWETLYDPGQGHFVGLGEASPILRYLSLPRSRSALPVKPPLRVLALLSSPAQLPSLDVEREWQAIQDALAGLVGDGKFVLERLPSPTLDALQQRLLGEPVHILHFIGHGVFDEAAQAGCLALEDARGRPHLVQGGDLAKLLRNHPAVRLAYLNACEGALASGQSVFTGVAQALVREGVPAAVAMQAEISDPGAIELARIFYTALAAGRPVDAALTQARVALSAAGSPEWAIPVLFSRSPDNRLFDIRQVLPTPDCPYPGMAPFSEAQKDLFFGREREIGEAVERLRQHPFLAIVGPSGSGKSSLIYAGVIPALRRSKRFGPGEWTVKIMRPGQHPLAALAERLGSSPGTLSSLTLTERTLLFIDQFEEVFTLAGAEEVQAFLTALQGLIGQPNLHILLTARADFYPDLMACPLWQPIRANRLELPPLGDDELWAAIVEPANRVGVTVDEALAVKLIADASGERGSLPLVQETLVLLWDRVEERQLALKAYQTMAEGGRSGLQVAIDRRASLVYDNLPEGVQPLARRIFLRLVQFGEGRADTRRQQTMDELRASGDDPDVFDQTLAKLTESRLLTSSGEEGGARRVDIAHEALIAGWPRLQEWLGQRRLAEQTRRRLEGKAAEWVAAQQKGGLLDEYELQEAESWLAGEDAKELGYSQALTDLLQASKDALAQAKTKEADAVRNRQRSRVFAGGLALAILVIALVGYFAWTAQRARNEAETAKGKVETAATAEATARLQAEAEAQRAATSEAEARKAQATAVVAEATAVAAKAEAERLKRSVQAEQLAAEALNIISDESGDDSLALILLRDAIRTTWDTDGQISGNVYNAATVLLGHIPLVLSLPVARHPPTGGVPAERSVNALAFSYDGMQLVTAGEDGTAKVWATNDYGPELSVLSGHSDSVEDVAFNQDGQYVVTAGRDGSVTVWDAKSERKLSIFRRRNDKYLLTRAVFSRDGQRILTWALNDAFIWDWKGVQPAVSIPVPEEVGLWDASFSPDGKQVITARNDGAVTVWDANSGKQVRALTGHTSGVSDAIFSPTGRQIATASRDGQVRIFEADSNEARWVLSSGGCGDNTSVSLGGYSQDGERLVTTACDGTAQVWDTTSGEKVFDVTGNCSYGGGAYCYILAAFSADRSRLTTVSKDGIIKVSNAENGDPIHTWSTDPQRVTAAIASRDGKRIVTASGSVIRIWDVESGEDPRVFPWHDGRVMYAAYSPDGQKIMTTGADQTVMLWDAKSGQRLSVIVGHKDQVRSAVFSADGKLILTASDDRTARLWNSDGKQLREFSGHGCNVVDSCGIKLAFFDNTANRILTVGDDALGKIWQVDATEPLFTIGEELIAGIETLAISRDGRRIVTGGIGGPVLWDMGTGKKLPTEFESQGFGVISVAFSFDGSRIVSGAEDGTLTVWNAESGDDLWTKSHRTSECNTESYLCAVGHKPLAMAFSPAGEEVVSAGEDGIVQVWDSETGQNLRAFGAHSGPIYSVSFSPDGHFILTAGDDGTARVWDATGSGELIEFTGHCSEGSRICQVSSAAYSTDGKNVVTVDQTGQAILWDAITGGRQKILARNLPTGFWSGGASAAFSPDGKRIVAVGGIESSIIEIAAPDAPLSLPVNARNVSPASFNQSGAVVLAAEDGTQVWDINEGKSLLKLSAPESAAELAIFSHGGDRIATVSEDLGLIIWDADNGGKLRAIREEGLGFIWAAFSPSGDRLVTAIRGKPARVWDARDGHKLFALSAFVERVQFDPAGRHIMGSNGREVWVWDAESGSEQFHFARDTVPWSSVYSPDGKRILLANDDGTASTWYASVEDLLAEIESRITRWPSVLSDEEKTRYGLVD